MSEQFGREVSLVVGAAGIGLSLAGLRIDFVVESSRVGFPNVARVNVYNLSESTREKLKEQYTDFSLTAGYVGNVGLIFRGQLWNCYDVKEGPDIITKMFGSDGAKDYETAMISKTLPAGENSPKQIVEACVNEFDDTILGNIDSLKELPSKSRAVTLSGNVKDELNKVARANNCEWCISNGELEFVSNDAAIQEVIVVSSESGMIGSAVVTDTGVSVTTLLNPVIRPNRVIQVNSNFSEMSFNDLEFKKRDTDLGGGFFRIDKVVYSGSNLDGEFVCKIEARRMFGDKVVESGVESEIQ